jgi:hypothetical protein
MSVEVAAVIAGLLVVAYNLRVALVTRPGRGRGPFI